jgi:plasmid stability protein
MLAACYCAAMSFIQVKNVPSDLQGAVRDRAAEEGRTVSDHVLDLPRRDLFLPSRRQLLARVESRQPVDVQAVAMLDAVRAEHEDEMSGTGS